MSKKGMSICKKGYSIDKVTLASSELKLLASFDGVEVMHQELDANITFDVYPAEEGMKILEFFYLLDGEIKCIVSDENIDVLTPGDYFYATNLKEHYVFKTLTKVKLLYVSSQPLFYYIGEALIKLHKINEQIERKDNYTRGHSERVQDYAMKIALELELERDKLAKLAIAALFHDLGKIYIEDYILNKPDKLTDNEYEKIKMHPVRSAQYVNEIKYIDVGDIVLQHHERIDGSGYPYGLKGDEICIEAKIIAVADTYDAMTSDRPYRKALLPKEALEEISRLSGKAYDQDVVKALVKALKKDKII